LPEHIRHTLRDKHNNFIEKKIQRIQLIIVIKMGYNTIPISIAKIDLEERERRM